jgi:YVTN family beta-propeller protein
LRRTAPAALLACAALLCWAAASAAAAPSPPLYVANEADNTVSVIDTGTGTVTANITVGSLPQAVALSPDGSTAYVTEEGSGTVGVIDTATNQVGEPITIASHTDSLPDGLALSPDGSRLYVTYGYRPGTSIGPGEVAVIDTATRAVGTPIEVGDEPAGIAVTPDGTKAFVADYGSGQVTEIEGLDGGSPHADPPVDVGGTPEGVAISADGSKVYVTNGNSDEVSVLSVATGEVTATLTDASFKAPQGIAASPAGEGAFVADFDGGGLTGLGAGDAVLGSVPVGGSPFGVAYDPDGKTVWTSVSPAEGAGAVERVDAATRAVVGAPITVREAPLGLAVAPDQAPEADLHATVRSAGAASEFDASASTVRYGTIVSYAWSFGDGATETTSVPITSHVYARPGVYTASVTETDSAGTSTARVFTGQTVSRNGGPGATASRSVVVTEPRAIATPSPTSLDFGTQVISQLYLSKPVTLTNTGDAPLQVSGVSINATGARSFVVDDDHCSGQTLAPGADCIVEVLFLPTSTGAKTASLDFEDDAPGSPQSVALAGIGESPVIAIAPARIEFPEQTVGTESAPRAVTVTNGGAVPLQVEGVEVTGQGAGAFAVVGDDCTAAPVEPGHSCQVDVRFKPGSMGAASALLRIEDDAPGSPHAAAMSGTGIAAEAAFSPTHLDFGELAVDTRAPDQTVTVTNTGNAPLHVTRAELGGTGAGPFEIDGDECGGKAIAPGATCNIELSFRASAPGTYTAALTLDSDAVGPAASATLEGKALAKEGGGSGGGGTGGGGGGDHPSGAQSGTSPPGPPAAHAPRARTLPARSLGNTRARLAGTVAPEGTPTRYRFQWGKTRRYGRTTPWRRIPGSARERTVSIVLKGLRPGATYHYRLIATSPAGTSRGRDRILRIRRP